MIISLYFAAFYLWPNWCLIYGFLRHLTRPNWHLFAAERYILCRCRFGLTIEVSKCMLCSVLLSSAVEFNNLSFLYKLFLLVLCPVFLFERVWECVCACVGLYSLQVCGRLCQQTIHIQFVNSASDIYYLVKRGDQIFIFVF